MLFNSVQFLYFFCAVYSLFLIVPRRAANLLLVLASYFFYGFWDWRFLFLLLVSTCVDYFCGLAIYRSEDDKKRKRIVALSIFVNLAILCFFKYYNFFIENLSFLLSRAGLSFNPVFLKIILPVGISFYTFQTMSYTIDIYRRQMKPTRNFINFALFVSFFPQLVAGPIERARNLLPQIEAERNISKQYLIEGAYLILWGLYLKMFVADNLAKIADPVFAENAFVSGQLVLVAALAFSGQVFSDFAGYSSIARGLGKLLGFELSVNFFAPLLARNPNEFLRRWHITFVAWMRDYLFFPLYKLFGQSKKAIFFSTAITTLLSGLWHGASWCFIVWAGIYTCFIFLHSMISPFLKGLLNVKSRIFQKTWVFIRVLVCSGVFVFSSIAFRSQSLVQMKEMYKNLFFNFSFVLKDEVVIAIINIAIFAMVANIVQFIQYEKGDVLAVLRLPFYAKTFIIIILFFSLIFLNSGNSEVFIYFQF